MRVKGEWMKRALSSMKPLNVPRKVSGLASQTGLMDLDQSSAKKHDEVNQLIREANRLEKEFRAYALPTAVDISKEGAETRGSPGAQMAQRLLRGKQLHVWIVEVCFVSSICPSEPSRL